MFAVIYRVFVKPDLEETFQKHWKAVATYFVEERGALGSSLHRSENGMWIAYSRWPDRKTRDSSWPAEGEQANPSFPAKVKEAIKGLKTCFKEELPQICMDVVEDVKQ